MAVFRGPRLYRTGRHGVIFVLALALALAVALGAWAQRRPPQGPRALAIVEWRAGAGEPRLLPLTIMENGQFFDAALYRVRSQPMALEPGTVYEVTRAGEPVGLFTVNNAERREREWVGLGRFRPMSEVKKEAPAPAEVVVPGAASDDDERPRLRRPGTQADGETGEVTAKEQPPSPKPPSPDDDPDRPRLRRPGQQEDGASGEAAEPKETPAPPAPNPDDDPDRPRLQRGGTEPAPKPAPKPPSAAPAEKGATAVKPASKPEAPGRVLLAVSDAKGPEARPYTFQWRPEEEQNIRRQAAALAEAEMAKAAKLAKASLRLEQVDLRAFDLDYDNAADVVLTARAAVPQGGKVVDHYILLVARMNIEGKLDKVFAAVSDDAHPEFTERYELIDAADADGDGRGDLVFRKWTGKQQSYVVYRYFRDSLYRLFESRAVSN